MKALAGGALLMLGACAGTPAADPPEVAARPDTRALAIRTTVKARKATIVLAARWRGEAKLEGIAKQTGAEGAIVARGSAVFDLRGLHVEASESIEVRYMDDPAHEDLVLSARDVGVFRQDVEFGHRTEDVDLVTMANDQVHIFKQ